MVILFLRRQTVAISPQNDGNGSNWQDLRDCVLCLKNSKGDEAIRVLCCYCLAYKDSPGT